MNVSSTALAGLARAEALLDRTAQRLARLQLNPDSGDTVDLSQEMIRLMEARTLHDANVKTIQTADEMTRETLKLFG